ncbi:MAG: AraC family transcriptional regulator [Eubacteriales bacterium]
MVIIMEHAIFRKPSPFCEANYCYADGCGFESYPDFRIRRKLFDNYLIMYVLSGTLIVEQYGHTYNITVGEYIALDLHDAHEYYFKNGDPATILWSHMNGNVIDLLFEKLKSTTPLPFIYKNISIQEKLEELLNLLKSADENGASSKLFEMMMLVFHDVESLQNPISATNDATKAFKMKVANYISNHIDKNISLEELANFMGLSKYYFIKKFTQIFQQTPMAYVVDEKMKIAIYYLSYTDNKIEVISTMLGFSDTAYFSNVFKKHAGLSPKNYREQFNEYKY